MFKFSFQRIVSLLIVAVIAFFMVKTPFVDEYISMLKTEAIETSLTKDPLYYEIEERRMDYEVPAQDAKIDKVWKKMPGYNGLVVDLEASYKNMKEAGEFRENLLVFKQISPKIHLADLPPSPIYRGHPDKPMVALTVNVAWGNEYLSPILATLKKHKIHGTFFLEGRWAKENPELVKMIFDAGHEIGNHSYSHPDMKTLSREQAEQELKETNAIIQATIGHTPKFFAPPSGSYKEETVEIADSLGMETIMWTVDTIDWKNPSPSVIINRVTKQVHNGAIILMHPTESSAKALETLIVKLQGYGYAIGTVTELLDEKRITVLGQGESNR